MKETEAFEDLINLQGSSIEVKLVGNNDDDPTKLFITGRHDDIGFDTIKDIIDVIEKYEGTSELKSYGVLEITL